MDRAGRLQNLGYSEDRSWQILPLFEELQVGDNIIDLLFSYEEGSISLEKLDMSLMDLWIKFSTDSTNLVHALRTKNKGKK